MDADEIAIAALIYLASDETRLERFVALTGITPGNLREMARQPAFLAAVLDHLASDESLLLAFAADNAIDPAAVMRAHVKLAGPRGHWDGTG